MIVTPHDPPQATDTNATKHETARQTAPAATQELLVRYNKAEHRECVKVRPARGATEAAGEGEPCAGDAPRAGTGHQGCNTSPHNKRKKKVTYGKRLQSEDCYDTKILQNNTTA